MKVLVTGACGFVGCNVIQGLAAAGHDVYATDLKQSRILEELGVPTLKKSLGLDVRSPGGILQLSKGMDAVVHLAAEPNVPWCAEHPGPAFEVNAVGTLNVLQQAREAGCKVILASTGSAANPNNPYAASKSAAEALCKAWYATYGVRTTVLRFTNLYGPWSAHKDNVIPTWVRRAQAGETLQVNGDGTHEVDFLNTADMARAVVMAVESDQVDGKTITIGSGTKTSLLRVLEILEHMDGGPGGSRVEFIADRAVPRPAVRPEAAVADRDLLGWAPIVKLEDGIRQLWDWYLQNQGMVEAPESAGIGSCELISAVETSTPGVMDIRFRDSRGKRRRKEVSRDSLVTWQAQLEKGLQRDPEADKTNHQVALAEAAWLIDLFPGADSNPATESSEV